MVEPASRSAAMDLRTAHKESTTEMGAHEMSDATEEREANLTGGQSAVRVRNDWRVV